LGGTKIEGIAIDEAGVERQRLRVATPKGDYAAIVQAIAGVVGEIEKTLGQQASVGVGIPGQSRPPRVS
jgi:fructokinase